MKTLGDILNDFCGSPKAPPRGSATSMERTTFINGRWRAEFKCIRGQWHLVADSFSEQRDAIVAASIHGAVYRNKQRKEIEAQGATTGRRKKLPISGALTDR